jgi:hypothetical protein
VHDAVAAGLAQVAEVPAEPDHQPGALLLDDTALADPAVAAAHVRDIAGKPDAGF